MRFQIIFFSQIFQITQIFNIYCNLNLQNLLNLREFFISNLVKLILKKFKFTKCSSFEQFLEKGLFKKVFGIFHKRRFCALLFPFLQSEVPFYLSGKSFCHKPMQLLSPFPFSLNLKILHCNQPPFL